MLVSQIFIRQIILDNIYMHKTRYPLSWLNFGACQKHRHSFVITNPGWKIVAWKKDDTIWKGGLSIMHSKTLTVKIKLRKNTHQNVYVFYIHNELLNANYKDKRPDTGKTVLQLHWLVLIWTIFWEKRTNCQKHFENNNFKNAT